MDETLKNTNLTKIDGSGRRQSYAPPAWLTEWRVEYPVPVGVDEVRLEVLRVERGLEPAGKKEIAKAVNAIMEFLSTFGMVKGDVKGIAEAYVDILGDVPADMLPAVASGIRRTWKYPHPPAPADLRAIVSEDIAKRVFVRMRLRTAAIRLGSDL